MTAPYTPLGKRQRLELLRSQLDTERQSFMPGWREENDYIRPSRARFFISDNNRGDRRNQKIIDSTATYAAGTLSSGMMTNVTNPARPWFRMGLPDPDLAESASVKDWLHNVTQGMLAVFQQSNLYDALPEIYDDLGVFGTAAMAVLDDAEDVLRFETYPIGSFWIANDARRVVRVFLREFRMTVRQLIEEFGAFNVKNEITNWDRFSLSVRNAYEQDALETWIDVVHVIEPNREYRPNLALSKHKRFASCYYEKGTAGNSAKGDPDRVLREEGFDEFPILVGRWKVTGGDVYATDCPGKTAIGDIKQLQQGEKQKLKAIGKLVDPPLVGSSNLRNTPVSLLPGGVTYDPTQGDARLKPLYEIEPRIAELSAEQELVRSRILKAFYVDILLMLATSDRRQITAREVDERHEEKLMALGHVLERLNKDILHPLIDRTFAIMQRRGLIPPPPEELQGKTLKVEYLGIMAIAQKMVGIAGLERFVGLVAQIAGFDPSILDKVDFDQLVDEYGESTGIPPRCIVPDEQVVAIRQQRAQQQQAAQMAENAQALSQSAKNLAGAPTEGKNALTDLLGAGAP